MSETLKDIIQGKVDKNMETYRLNPQRIKSDYTIEKAQIENYNNRQLLELLQNADDAKSNKVLIQLDTQNSLLSIANQGDPFELEGIDSLLIAGNSSKNKKDFIGNKGLGFRSILSWVESVKIISKRFTLEFSKPFIKEKFKEFKQNSAEFRQLVTKLKDLGRNEIPFAVLSLPASIEEGVDSEWETTIELDYYPSQESSIRTQIDKLTAEILVFLNHIHEISIEIDGEVYKSILKDPRGDKHEAIVDGIHWNLFDTGIIEYEKNKYYNIKLAWQNGLLDDDTMLYTYFPTKVKSHFPYLIHATFELDSSRNNVNESEVNKLVFDKIKEAQYEVVQSSLLAEDSSSWDAFHFLLPSERINNDFLDKYYSDLKAYRATAEIIPCVNDSYVNHESAIYYTDEFSEWVVRNNVGKFFPNLVKPIPESIKGELRFSHYNYYQSEDLIQCLEEALNSRDSLIQERVDLIRILRDSAFKGIHGSEHKLSLLLEDKEGNLVPIKYTHQAFIIKAEIDQFKLPTFVQIKFMSQEMYNRLLIEFQDEIKDLSQTRDSNEPISRKLRILVKDIVNIGSDDIALVVENIISSLKAHLKENDDINVVRSVVRSLYLIYSDNPEGKNVLPVSVPLVNRAGGIFSSHDLVFGKDYLGGGLTEYIFDGVYDNRNYLTGNDFWKLDELEGVDLKYFFKWLGVDNIVQIEKNETAILEYGDFASYVFSHITKPEKITTLTFNGYRFRKPEILKELSLYKLLLLIYYKEEVFEQITEHHKDQLFNKYGNAYPKALAGIPSFIKFQLTRLFDFKNILVDGHEFKGGHFMTIDLEHQELTEVERYLEPTEDLPSKTKLEYILSLLEAVNSIYELQPKQISDSFINHADRFEEGKGSRAFYLHAFDYYLKNKETKYPDRVEVAEGRKYFARMGGKGNDLRYLDASDIYYFDNKQLPDSILNDYPIINLPKRLGERNVKEFFGINLITDEMKEIQMNGLPDINVGLTAEFENWLNNIKVFLLCYRLSTLKKTDYSEALNRLKSLKVQVVTNCSFSFRTDNTLLLEENSFVIFDNIVYVKSTLQDIEALKRSSSFCDAFAEILSVVFKVADHKNNFRSIFKDPITETRHLIIEDELTAYLEAAEELLGISGLEYDFWRKVAENNGCVLEDGLNCFEQLKKFVSNQLKFNIPGYYHKIIFQEFSSKEALNLIEELVLSGLIEYKEIALLENVKRGLFDYHKRIGRSRLHSYKSVIEQLVHNKLKDSTTNKKGRFEQKILIEQSKLSSEFTAKLSELVSTQLEIDYDQIVGHILKKNHGYDPSQPEVNIHAIYDSNKTSLKNVKIDELDSAERSLLYFEWGSIDELLILIDQTKENESEETDDTEEVDDLSSIEIVNSKLGAVIPPQKKNGQGGGGSHNHKTDRAKRKKGKKAEKLVKEKLVAEGYQAVQWVSGNSDGPTRDDSLGYDLRFVHPEEGQKYVEVKALSPDGSIFISENEKSFGLENKDSHILALVSENQIYWIENFFQFDESENFRSNNMYTVLDNDYKVYFNIIQE